MKFEEVDKSLALLKSFQKTTNSENCYANENMSKVFEEYLLTLITIDAICARERELISFTIAKGKEDLFYNFYNNDVLRVVELVFIEFYNYLGDRLKNITEGRDEDWDKLLYMNDARVYKRIFENFISRKNISHTNETKKRIELYGQSKIVLDNIIQKFPVLEKDKFKFSSDLDHRHEAIIYKYKVDAKYISALSPTEIENQFGPKRKQAYYTVWNQKGVNFKPISQKELETIIPYLNDYPVAQQAAVDDWNKLS